MKNTLLLLFLFLSSSLFAQNTDTTFALQFNSTTYVEMHCPTCPDADYSIEYRPALTKSWARFELAQVAQGIFAGTVSLHLPETVRLLRNKPQRNYVSFLVLVPNDTLKVQIKYDKENDEYIFEKILTSQYPTLTQYAVDKIKDLGYHETDFALAGLTPEEKLAFIKKEIAYLEAYQKKHSLPLWFFNQAKESPQYIISFDTSLVSPPLSNRHALGSTYYMMHLDNFIQVALGYKKISEIATCAPFLSDSTLQTLKVRAEYAEKQVAFEVAEYYKLYLLTNFLTLTSDEKEASTLFNILNFKQEAIKNYAIHTINDFTQQVTYLNTEKKLPEFLLKDIEGNLVLLNESLGKTVYLSFWFPSCAPCIRAIPDKNKLVESLPSDEFELINICVSGSEQEWQNAIERFQMKGKNFYVSHTEIEKELTQLFGISTFPHYAILKDGKILIRKANSPNKIAPELRDLLKK
ncbi:TlpA family protein disulfide reductase [Hugenholtzia roseola]|uniref:TlpA family protein disulfide reductase n=1 Tax=Hugenholtzia roseola TaxID=1002 RepID=UPI00047AF3EC|nr:TlpA disulfide reductase family protein [Hugenholtzia roseola]